MLESWATKGSTSELEVVGTRGQDLTRLQKMAVQRLALQVLS